MLGNSRLVGPAVGLLMHFPQLGHQFDALEILWSMLDAGLLSMAEKWAVNLGPDVQVGSFNLASILHLLHCQRGGASNH